MNFETLADSVLLGTDVSSEFDKLSETDKLEFGKVVLSKLRDDLPNNTCKDGTSSLASMANVGKFMHKFSLEDFRDLMGNKSKTKPYEIIGVSLMVEHSFDSQPDWKDIIDAVTAKFTAKAAQAEAESLSEAQAEHESE